MPKIVDSSKLLPRRDPQYLAWQQFLAEIHGAEHRYNSKDQTPAAKLKYFVKMYDNFGAMMVHIVNDHSSALACGKGLDACAKKLGELFPNFLQAGDDRIAQDVVRKLYL